jgi:hypothetical protein
MWAQLVTVALGIWLMAAPAVLAFMGAARTNHQVVGPIIATFAWIAATECTRGLRRANLPLGAWLVVAPLLIDHDAAAALNSMVTGAAVAILSFVRGATHSRFAGGWRSLW